MRVIPKVLKDGRFAVGLVAWDYRREAMIFFLPSAFEWPYWR